MKNSLEELESTPSQTDDSELEQPYNLSKLDQKLLEDLPNDGCNTNSSKSVESSDINDIKETAEVPSEIFRLDQESFDDSCRQINQALAYEMLDRYEPGNPRLPSHAERMEYLIESRQTDHMLEYLDFVTSPEYAENQQGLNEAEKSILQATAANGILRDADIYRTAADEVKQEALLDKARTYLRQARESLKDYDKNTPSLDLAHKVEQIQQFIDEISNELERSSLKTQRDKAMDALKAQMEAAELREIEDDLMAAGRRPRLRPVDGRDEQTADRQLKNVA